MKIDLRKFANDPLAFFNALEIPTPKGKALFADTMQEFQREWFEAVAPSLLALGCGKPPEIKKFWTTRSKGASKDADSGCAILWLLAFSRVPLDMVCGAADQAQAHELKKAIVDVIRLNEWLRDRITINQWQLKCQANGAELTILTSDTSGGAHGARPHLTLINELSHIGNEEFPATLMDNATKRGGITIIATNAGFQNTWQHNWRELAQSSDRWHFQEVNYPAPWVPDEEIEDVQFHSSVSRFRRLYYSDWLVQNGDALDVEDVKACADDRLKPLDSPGDPSNYFYVAGLDIGVRQDHSALVILEGRRDNQLLRLAYAKSWKPDPTTKQVNLIEVEREILELHIKFNEMFLAFDPWQASLMAQRLAKLGQFKKWNSSRIREVPFTGKNLNQMASTLLEVFRSRRIRLYTVSQGQEIIDQLGLLTLEEKSYGYRLSAPARTKSGGHSDLATALAIALPLAIEESGKRGTVYLNCLSDATPADSRSTLDVALGDFEQRKKEYDEAKREMLNWSSADERKLLASEAIYRHLYGE